MALRAVLLLGFLAALAGRVSAASAYPCHKYKNKMGENVSCTAVALPKGLCTKCPLRPPNSKGQFLECWNTFDTDASTCLPAMEEYAAANPCDVVRVKAVADLKANPADGDARSIVDYFLYSVCEQCCDCVPMGANSALYTNYLVEHSASNPSLYDPTRGNCPAHAYYDICKILPKVTHFTNIGEVSLASAAGIAPACPMLTGWFNSPESNGWQQNPKTKIVPPLNAFFLNMLDKLECAKKDVWDTCYALEAAQRHLGVPEDAPEVNDKPPPPAESVPTPGVEPLAPDTLSGTPLPQAPAPETAAPVADETNAPSPPPTSASTTNDTNSTTVPGGGGIGGVSEGGVSDGGSNVAGDVTGTAEQNMNSTSSSGSCFPAHATVMLRGGQKVLMEDLQIGNEVLVAGGKFSTVYLFSHRDALYRSMHVRITLASGGALELTPGHYLSVNGVLAAAGSITIGDVLQGAHGLVTVTDVSNVIRRGLYNPHTIAGTVVVDDVMCSTYTTAVKISAAQALLAPIRALFRVGAVTEAFAGEFLQRGAESVHVGMPVLS